jgi:hypothetical protein
MNLRRLAVLLTVVAAAAVGCAVQGKPFEKISSPPGNAVIYVYRPYGYVGSVLRPAVTCGEDTARIGPGGYHAFIVPAGEKITCSIETDGGEDELEFQTERRSYYVREELGLGQVIGGIKMETNSTPHLSPIDTDAAQTEIKTCCVLEAQTTGSAN